MSISLLNAVPAGAIEVLSDANGAPHFKRADLGRFLGLVNVKGAYRELKTISRKALFKTGDTLLRGQNDHDVFFTLDDAMEIIVRSNKPKAIDILEKMGSKMYRHKYVRKETETLSYIQRAFKGEEMIDQYCVDGYRIDLYFPKYKLAVECDEFDHNGRDIEYEVKRQKHIEIKLDCHFIRYNPDADDFDPFNLLNRIYQQLC